MSLPREFILLFEEFAQGAGLCIHQPGQLDHRVILFLDLLSAHFIKRLAGIDRFQFRATDELSRTCLRRLAGQNFLNHFVLIAELTDSEFKRIAETQHFKIFINGRFGKEAQLKRNLV